MNRRAALSALLVAPAALASPAPAAALLVGDSLAFQLAPRLRKAMGERRLAADGRGGSSTRQWRDKWFRRAVERYPGGVVLVSLGVNCTRSERPRLAEDIGALVDVCEDVFQRQLLWLLPPPLKFSTKYLRDAVAEVGCSSFDPGVLPLGDGVHPTHAGYEKWATMLVKKLYG